MWDWAARLCLQCAAIIGRGIAFACLILIANMMTAAGAPNLTLTDLAQSVHAHGNKPLARSLEHHHRHLAARAIVQGNAVGAQERRDTAGYIVRRKADGSLCRVKGSKFTPSASAVTTSAASSTSAAAPSTTQAPAATTQPALAAAQNQPSPSAGGNNNNQQQWGQPAPSPSPAPSANNNNNNGGGGGKGGGQTGGWTNSGSKLGLAWPNGNWDAAGSPGYVGNYIGSKSSWYYTWSPWNVVCPLPGLYRARPS